MDTGTLNFLWSRTLVAGFVAAGVEDAVISPGSRSTPLALALLRQPGLRCEVAVDERSAAFFALGIAKASRRPVIVLATSGTAPANWLPAVVEANHAAVPLLLLSADRPPELQGCGANQTIDQLVLFGRQVRASHALGTPPADFDPATLHALAARACEQACWPLPGPVHLNQPFREPLLPQAELPPAIATPAIRVSHPAPLPDEATIRELADRLGGRPGAIVCGELPAQPGLPEAITELAQRLACPILAEPLSGLRFGRHDKRQLVVRYNRWLDDDAPAGDWLLRFGAYPVTRKLQDFVARERPTAALIDPLPRWNDPAASLTHLLRADPLAVCRALLGENPDPAPAGWLAAFADREQAAAALAEPSHIPLLIDALADGTPLFVGNSLAIRELDSLSGTRDQALPIYGNRGASGIDGNIATALGLAVVHGRVVALLGDLTCQHDLGSLALAKGRDAVIVAVNNGGGGIFDLLPQHALPEFETGWRTPQQLDFAQAAAAFGLGYRLATTLPAFAEALAAAQAAGGPQLLELKIS